MLVVVRKTVHPTSVVESNKLTRIRHKIIYVVTGFGSFGFNQLLKAGAFECDDVISGAHISRKKGQLATASRDQPTLPSSRFSAGWRVPLI